MAPSPVAGKENWPTRSTVNNRSAGGGYNSTYIYVVMAFLARRRQRNNFLPFLHTTINQKYEHVYVLFTLDRKAHEYLSGLFFLQRSRLLLSLPFNPTILSPLAH